MKNTALQRHQPIDIFVSVSKAGATIRDQEGQAVFGVRPGSIQCFQEFLPTGGIFTVGAHPSQQLSASCGRPKRLGLPGLAPSWLFSPDVCGQSDPFGVSPVANITVIQIPSMRTTGGTSPCLRRGKGAFGRAKRENLLVEGAQPNRAVQPDDPNRS